MDRLVSSKHLEGVSDLTLTAPIKQGFIDAFESVTYETRLRLIMEALFKIRSTAREHSTIKPFVDTAERIQALLDFRLVILDDTEPRQLLLSATFDRPFEPYMRLIWDPLGPLLDVVFCNCEGYVTATEHSFPEYLAWVRKSQIDTDFFYSASGHSVTDIQYVTKIERLQREARGRYLPSGIVADDANAMARLVRKDPETAEESNRMGMQALVALYRLADMYPPEPVAGDGKYLRWAAQQLLDGWGRADLKSWANLVVEQLHWLEKDPLPRKVAERPALAARLKPRLTFKDSDIQGGILGNYGNKQQPVQHGAILLMGITDPAKARKTIAGLPVQPRLANGAEAAGGIFLNLAFTRRGLATIGVPAAEIERLPQEFREGMEARAGLLGDIRFGHPRRWKLPQRYRPGGADAAAGQPLVELSEVDLVIQLRTTGKSPSPEIRPGHPLYASIREFETAEDSGLELLAVEAMGRASNPKGSVGRDHFGFVDGISQPRPVDGTPERENDEVARGELFLGYCNDRSDPPTPESAILDNGTFLVLRKLRQHAGRLDDFVEREAEKINRNYARSKHERIEDGSFEYGEPGDEAMDGAGPGRTDSFIDKEALLGKMMGRDRDGNLLVPSVPAGSNRFGYRRDRTGAGCPFQAHIRRTNPRTPLDDDANSRPTPRILRRGMSYGPPVPRIDGDKSRVANEDESVDRGVYFMAYNASIAEQFEVIQRWINGGNSTGVASWQNDPLMGVGQHKDRRTFRFRHKGCTIRVDIPDPFVELQWGAYLFVPSIAAIQAIAKLEPDVQQIRAAVEFQEARKGEAIIAKLLALAAEGPAGRKAAAARWKTCLEDFSSKDPAERNDGPAVWAAIRAYHGGLLRVPYGIAEDGKSPGDVVLVGSKGLVMRVFRESKDLYSMRGQMDRMKQSFGPIFLGLDGGDEYDEKSKINADILKIGEAEAFGVAYCVAAAWLEQVLGLFCRLYGPEEPGGVHGRAGELDLRRNFITPVLAGVCNQWFGIPDTLDVDPDDLLTGDDRLELPKVFAVDEGQSSHVLPGGWSWKSDRKPRCPGDYMSTSRYCFYPDPVPRVQAYGKAHGQALRKAVRAHFEQLEKDGRQPQAKLALAMKGHFQNDVDELARTLIGVMTGFLPPADASLRWTLYEWLEEKTFWRLQQDVVSAKVRPEAASAAADMAAAEAERAAKANGLPKEQVAMAAAGARVAAKAYLRAKPSLSEPLMRAMQKRPSPDMLWRTAARNHRLGGIEIEEGDRIFIGIVSAMAEDVAAGVTDAYPVFGGNREDRKDPPLHACPAYKFAIGTMLGIFTALFDKVRVEALPAPLLVKVSDLSRCPTPPAPAPEPSSQVPSADVEPRTTSLPQSLERLKHAPIQNGAEELPRVHEESSESERIP